MGKVNARRARVKKREIAASTRVSRTESLKAAKVAPLEQRVRALEHRPAGGGE